MYVTQSILRIHLLNFWLLFCRVNKSSPISEHIHVAIFKVPQQTEKDLSYLWNFSKRLAKAIFKTLSPKILLKIIAEFTIDDLGGSFKNIISYFKNITSSLKRTRKYISNPKDLLDLVKKSASKLKGATSIEMDKIKKEIGTLNIKTCLSIIAKALFWLLAAYCGYSVPDLDIKFFGIGSHRHFFTHSILPAISVALAGKFICRFLDHVSSNCQEADKDIKNILEEFKRFIGIGVSGFTVGITAHLFQDLFIDGSQTIRGPWEREQIPNWARKNYRFDDGYLAVNATWGSCQGISSFRKSRS